MTYYWQNACHVVLAMARLGGSRNVSCATVGWFRVKVLDFKHDLQNQCGSTLRQLETRNNLVAVANPSPVREFRGGCHFAQRGGATGPGEARRTIGGRCDLDCEIGSGKRGAECQAVIVPLDACEFPGRPISRYFAEFHPSQVVKALVQTADDFLKDFESALL